MNELFMAFCVRLSFIWQVAFGAARIAAVFAPRLLRVFARARRMTSGVFCQTKRKRSKLRKIEGARGNQ